MKPLSSRSGEAGFTLIELLVTIAILSIILLMAMRVTESARDSIRIAESMSNNDAIARQAFDQITRDVSNMRTDGFARIEFSDKSGNDEIMFLSNNPGFTDAGGVGKRGVSQINYTISNDSTEGDRLVRSTRGFDFNGDLKLDPAQSFTAIAAGNEIVASNNVIRFEVEYLIGETNLTDPANPITTITREINAPDTTENLRGLVISLVTVDAWTRRALRPDRLQDIAEKFPDAALGANTLKTWSDTRDDLARSGLSGYPRQALQSIRCYQRTILTP
jgi:prepilin-type N-terminal cleavage/methylation domain-containing protein